MEVESLHASPAHHHMTATHSSDSIGMSEKLRNKFRSLSVHDSRHAGGHSSGQQQHHQQQHSHASPRHHNGTSSSNHRNSTQNRQNRANSEFGSWSSSVSHTGGAAGGNGTTTSSSSSSSSKRKDRSSRGGNGFKFFSGSTSASGGGGGGNGSRHSSPSRSPTGFKSPGAFYRFHDARPQSKRRSSKSPKQRLLKRATVSIAQSFQACNPEFRYSRTTNPKRVLSSPATTMPGSYHNKDFDLVISVNDMLAPEVNGPGDNGVSYRVIDMLGKGTFGQVVKCESTNGEEVAVKVIKNKPAYYNQATTEIKILKMLNEEHDPHDNHHIVRLLHFFKYKKHLCLVFELLNVNLYDLLKQNRYRGLSCSLIRAFVKQVLDTLVVLRRARIIHCDLKPENILMMNLSTPRIKVIDFGSACFETQTIYSYIQSRFYRSPEILVGHKYECNIDMWSLGCIAAELFLGLPLYPGKHEYEQLSRIAKMQGDLPNSLLDKGQKSKMFFNKIRRSDGSHAWKLKSPEQFEQENNKPIAPAKKYFEGDTLDELVEKYPLKRRKNKAKTEQERATRKCFIHFLKGLLEIDPKKRWTPAQAALHPFIKDTEFTGSFEPPPDNHRPMSRAPRRNITQQSEPDRVKTTGSAAALRERHSHRHHHSSQVRHRSGTFSNDELSRRPRSFSYQDPPAGGGHGPDAAGTAPQPISTTSTVSSTGSAGSGGGAPDAMIDDAGVVGGSVQQHSRARSISNYDASVSQSAQHSHRHHVNHHHRQIREQKVAAAMQQGPSTLGSTLGTRQRLRTSSSNSSSRSSRRSQHLRVDHGNNRSPVDVQMSPAASPSQHHGHGQHNGAMRIGVMNSPVMPGRPGRSQSDTSSFDIAEYRRSRKIYSQHPLYEDTVQSDVVMSSTPTSPRAGVAQQSVTAPAGSPPIVGAGPGRPPPLTLPNGANAAAQAAAYGRRRASSYSTLASTPEDEDTNMMSPGRYNGQNPQMNPMTPTQMRARENSIGSWTDPYSPGGAYAQLGPDTMRCSIGSIGSMSSLGTLAQAAAAAGQSGAAMTPSQTPLQFSPPSRNFGFAGAGQNFFPAEQPELAHVATGLTPVAHAHSRANSGHLHAAASAHGAGAGLNTAHSAHLSGEFSFDPNSMAAAAGHVSPDDPAMARQRSISMNYMSPRMPSQQQPRGAGNMHMQHAYGMQTSPTHAGNGYGFGFGASPPQTHVPQSTAVLHAASRSPSMGHGGPLSKAAAYGSSKQQLSAMSASTSGPASSHSRHASHEDTPMSQ